MKEKAMTEEDYFDRFYQTLDLLLAGNLLLCVHPDGYYFDSRQIYSSVAGYVMGWDNYIGYQNAVFFSRWQRLGDFPDYPWGNDGSGSAPAAETDQVVRAKQIIKKSRELFDALGSVGVISKRTDDYKAALYEQVVSFYIDMLLYQAMERREEPDSHSVCAKHRWKKLDAHNIRAAWKKNEVKVV